MKPCDFEILRVSVEDEGRLVLVELDHGKANEMGSAALTEWGRLVSALEHDGHAVALITYSKRRSAKGQPIFIAGADVAERTGWDDERVKAHVRWQREILHRLRHAPVLHLTAVHGIALGWGTEFLLTADYRLVTPEAVFGLPETGLGILPGAGGTAELWSYVGVAQALRLGMTGERIGADEAVRIGLAEELHPDIDAALARARIIAQATATRSPTAVAAYKAAVLAAVGSPPHERAQLEAAAYAHCVDAGEAALGRAHFKDILTGTRPPWPSRKPWSR